jgi:acyl carrier protein
VSEFLAAVETLQELPKSERVGKLEELVTSQIKAILLMPDDEELPLTESFFDLGLTSLLLGEVKAHLEALLGCHISTTQLFNKPTVDQLMTHLTTEVLTGLFED